MPIRVLFVEPDSAYAQSVRERARDHHDEFELVIVPSLGEAADEITRCPPDAVVADLRNGTDAEAVIHAVRASIQRSQASNRGSYSSAYLRENEAQLRQAQKMEAVGRLAGGVAHDFNNVLTAIFGYADLLLDSFDPHHPGRNDLLEIKRAAERAANLTRQLLAFSRKQVLQPRRISLNAVVTNIEQLLRRLMREDVQLCIDLDASAGLVHADPGQLEQVLMNLAANARDAMPDGGTLTISTANETI